MAESLPSEWIDYSIDEIKANSKGAIAIGPFGSRMKSDCYVEIGIPVIRGNNISITKELTGDFVCISEELADELSICNVSEGDLVFPHRGLIGEVGIVTGNDKARYVLSSSLMKLTCNKDIVDPLFLFYFFRSPIGRHELLKNTSQVGTPGIATPLASLKSIHVLLPPLNKQRAIARILGTLDDKIELNRRMNETLEAMARAIFKSWFVDFDPVRAKAEDREPAGMDAETAAVFPDSFEETELGMVPKNWTVAGLGGIVDVIDCLHSKKPERQQQGKPLLQLWNIQDKGLIDMDNMYLISEEDYKLWTSRIEAQPGDCVITNVGRVGAVAQIPAGVKAALGRNMTALRCNGSYPFPTFLVQCLLSSAMADEIQLKIDTGTILEALNVRNIPKLRLVLPPRNLLSQFEKECRPLRSKMEQNLAESRTISDLKTAILEKLFLKRSE